MDRDIDRFSGAEFRRWLYEGITNSVCPSATNLPQVTAGKPQENKTNREDKMSTKRYVCVEPMANNQFKIFVEDGVYFQSYSSVIAFRPLDSNLPVVLDKRYWNYSVTTGKYRNQFLGEGIAETRKKIKLGKYILADLN